jgi:hypothetical protein
MAMGGLPPHLDWPSMAPNVIPILPRRRALPLEAGEPFRVTLPPGIPTGFGIDIGPPSSWSASRCSPVADRPR